MASDVNVPQAAIKYSTQVLADGKLELHVPFPPGSRVAVFVVEEGQEFADLVGGGSNESGILGQPIR